MSTTLTTRQLNKLKKRKLGRTEQIIRLIPLRYYDARFENGLHPNYHEHFVTVIGILKSITVKESESSKKLRVVAKIQDRISRRTLNITWFGNYDIYRTYRYHVGQNFLIHGKLEYNNEWNSFHMTNPFLFTSDIMENLKLHAYYGNGGKGLGENVIPAAIKEAVKDNKTEYIPMDLLKQYQLPDINEMGRMLHFPKNPEEINKAIQRLYFDEMLDFSIGMKEKEIPNGKPCISFKTSELTNKIIKELPYELTKDQRNTIISIYNNIREKKIVNALVQGDVACGKTITAFLMMFMAVENGYQALLMAPTTVLATQHYQDLTELAEKYNKKVVFLKSEITTSERKEILSMIKNGEADFIIATHAAVSSDVKYHNLGLAVIDEEHKFGVETKEKIREKSDWNLPFITMSATPIPRTLATTIYGDFMDIYTIESMPNGRKPVKTFCHTDDTIPPILMEQLKQGHQAYIVCPLIEEAKEDTIMENCLSVEEILSLYRNAFANYPNIRIEALTGKTAEKDALNILKDFKDNKIQILVSTTVIEVGVNNPNATVILLQNAERYSLSSMHQLRGRVRRGYFDPYCILISKAGRDNPRLDIMCKTDNGFKIAEADLEIRKTGNLLGLEQSGANKQIELILTYPNMYNEIKKIAEYMINKGQTDNFKQYMKDLQKM